MQQNSKRQMLLVMNSLGCPTIYILITYLNYTLSKDPYILACLQMYWWFSYI